MRIKNRQWQSLCASILVRFQHIPSILLHELGKNRCIGLAGVDPLANHFGNKVGHSTAVEFAGGQRIPMPGAGSAQHSARAVNRDSR